MTIFTGTTSRLDPISRLFLRDQTTFWPPPITEPDQTSGRLETPGPSHGSPDEPATETSSAAPVRPDETTSADHSEFQDDMVQLELAAEMAAVNNLQPFLLIYRQIDWQTRSGDDFAQAARLALRVGAPLIARECALTGSQRFPDHAELQKIARLLSPPEARSVPGQGNTSWKANRAWFQQHWDAYRGHWVALRDGQLLAVADDVNGLAAQVGELKGTDILITSIW